MCTNLEGEIIFIGIKTRILSYLKYSKRIVRLSIPIPYIFKIYL